jgi:hypothetical protein
MHRHKCNTHSFLFNLENQTKDFSYTIFHVKKNKCWKNFKIMRKSLFNYSFYSHPEIGNFRLWHTSSYKRGSKGTCKGIHDFGGGSQVFGDFLSLRSQIPSCVYSWVFSYICSGIPSDSWIPNIGAHRSSERDKTSWVTTAKEILQKSETTIYDYMYCHGHLITFHGEFSLLCNVNFTS